MKQILPTIPPISKRTTKLPLTWHHWEQKYHDTSRWESYSWFGM